jgi:hypothetical protein
MSVLAVTVWTEPRVLAAGGTVYPDFSARVALSVLVAALEAAVSTAGQAHDLKKQQRLPRR